MVFALRNVSHNLNFKIIIIIFKAGQVLSMLEMEYHN
jgi:hypothetical protein